MNFFDAQDQARRASRWLVIVYGGATLLIVAGVTLVVAAAFYGFDPQSNPPDVNVLAGTAIAATVLILGATLYRTARLSSGGGRVATELGGTRITSDVSDPLRRRLRNVVEEMAIASGVPVPEIYVLEHEPGINAFAAGFAPGDAAVAVTRGALELLDRDELQGVVAHEFSHILNGDMRLNIRMMGVLFGIMVVSLVGRMILRGGSSGRRGGRGSGAVVVLGLGLTVLGWIGVFFARLLKAAVSRQREYLADASAVQFTRQTDGIANALKKIGGYSEHSYIQDSDAEEVSHMLFAHGARFSAMFATHPPLTDRIRALDPDFDGSRYPTVSLKDRRAPDDVDGDARIAGFDTAARAVEIDAETLADSVGKPGPAHVGFAAALRQSIPESLRIPAHSASEAYLVVLALLIDPSGQTSSRQLDFLRQQLGDERAAKVSGYFDELRRIGPVYRLPLLEISFPALKIAPVKQLDFLLDLARRLIELDGEVDFYEFCFYRILTRSIDQAHAPAARDRRVRATRWSVRNAALTLLRLVADRGHDSEADKQRAFEAGVETFGDWAGSAEFEAVGSTDVEKFESCLDVLSRLNGKATRTLLKALTATVSHDGRINIAEAEMTRAICATLDCPLPPLLSRQTVTQ